MLVLSLYLGERAHWFIVYWFNMRQGRGSEATEAVFLPWGQKSLFIPGCVSGAIIFLVCVCQCVC